MHHLSSDFHRVNDLVKLSDLKLDTQKELESFYVKGGSLNQFFFSAISEQLNTSDSPFIIGYLSNLLAGKFLNYDFSSTGRKSMWKYMMDDKDISISEDLRGQELLSQKYQDYAELALFHAGFLRNYDESNSILKTDFYNCVGPHLFKNSSLNTSDSYRKDLLSHMDYYFKYYGDVLSEVADDYVWNKKNTAYLNSLTKPK